MIIGCGVKSSLQKLMASLSRHPTLEERKIADLLLEYVGGNYGWQCIAIFPLLWRDLDLWNRTIERCPSPSDMLKEAIFFAWDTFGFQQVQSRWWPTTIILCSIVPYLLLRSYGTIISAIRQHENKIDFIHEINARAASLDEREVVEAWCNKQIICFMNGFNTRYASYCNILISIAKEDGIKLLKDL